MNFKPNLWKVIVSDIITIILTSITIVIFFPFPASEQLEQTEGSLMTTMINLPEPIVLLYLLILLILYYTSIYIIWSLIEKSRSKIKEVKKVKKVKK